MNITSGTEKCDAVLMFNGKEISYYNDHDNESYNYGISAKVNNLECYINVMSHMPVSIHFLDSDMVIDTNFWPTNIYKGLLQLSAEQISHIIQLVADSNFEGFVWDKFDDYLEFYNFGD